MITSIHNDRIRHLVRLRKKSSVRREGFMLLDGERIVSAALNAGVEILEAYRFVSAGPDDRPDLLASRLLERGIRVHAVSKTVFSRISYGEIDCGWVALARAPKNRMDTLLRRKNETAVLLDRVEKPGNVGAVLRTLDALGFCSLGACDLATDLFNPNIVRASMGACFTVPSAEGTIDDFCSLFCKKKIPGYVLDPGAKKSYFEIDLRTSAFLVAGSEHRGIRRRWIDAGFEPIAIPMQGTVDSLNVSVALTAVLFESLRQRKEKPS
jgi:TrmH family RNA methyltransferase